MMNAECERIRLAAMALADSEPAEISMETFQRHVAGCDLCKQEIAAITGLQALLSPYARERHAATSADAVIERIASEQASAKRLRMRGILIAFLLGLSLIGGRAVVLVSDAPVRWLTRTAVCLCIVGYFIGSRENPFKLNPQLQTSKEIVL